jgi:hypothetical protein
MADTSSSPIATLFPGYFALVMATGIVAIGADQQNLDLARRRLYVITRARVRRARRAARLTHDPVLVELRR